MDKVEKHVLIVAGGDGTRMGNKLPKQFCSIAGKPMLFLAFQSFMHLHDVKYTLVLGSKYIEFWQNLCNKEGFNIPHDIAVGGPTRFHSVKSGLKNISSGSLVLIHDAARPFVSKQTIKNIIEIASVKGNAIPVINITDTIRKVEGAYSNIIDRNKLRAVQTPQGFHASLIKSAYNQPYNETFTDDANVLESTGVKINIVAGNAENIKISNPIDLIIAEGIHRHLAQ